jgi:hypothetical protein
VLLFLWLCSALPRLMTPQVERVPADSFVRTTGDADDDTIEAPAKLRCVVKAARAVDVPPSSGDVDAVAEPCNCMCCQLGYFPIDSESTPIEDTPSSEPPASIEVLGGAGVDLEIPKLTADPVEPTEVTPARRRVRTRPNNPVLPRRVRRLINFAHLFRSRRACNVFEHPYTNRLRYSFLKANWPCAS